MNSELINKIISKMEKELHPDQLTKLESVLTEIQNEKNFYNVRVHSFQPRLSPVKIATNQFK